MSKLRDSHVFMCEDISFSQSLGGLLGHLLPNGEFFATRDGIARFICHYGTDGLAAVQELEEPVIVTMGEYFVYE